MSKISIVVPAYNKADYLVQCLDSLRAQTFANLEIVVVDDCSPDDSAERVAAIAREDGRVRLVRQPANGGTLVARKTGVLASTGDYVMLIDQDDALEPETCKRLMEEEARDPVDILHFGVRVVAHNDLAADAIAGMARFMNPEPRSLFGDEILEKSFVGMDDGGFDWNVHHKLYRGDMAREAMKGVKNERLTRPDDAYLSFALDIHAKTYRALADSQWYVYNLGRGVTLGEKMSLETFEDVARQDARAFELSADYAKSVAEETSVSEHACVVALANMKTRLVEHTMNDCKDGFSGPDFEPALEAARRYWDGLAVAGELFRFLRDEVYDALQHSEYEKLDDLKRERTQIEMASSSVVAHNSGIWGRRYFSMLDEASSHISELERRGRDVVRSSQSIRIFISTHKDVDLFKSVILQPVQVGCALRDWTFDWALHDDAGENISSQNPMYCELTTQYWAWKNVEADYYGFCHYRRYFDFAEERHEENEWGEVIDGRIDAASQARYGLDDATITKAVEGFDVITTVVKDLREFPGDDNTPLKQYKAAKKLHFKDLEHVIEILKDMHPDYFQDADAFLNGNRSCFCNMFIMRKEIFRDYCAWLFPILARFVDETDFSTYSVEAVRTPGHLSERLFNIYLNHQQRTGANWRTKQVQCVHFEQPDRHADVLEPPLREAGGKKIVPVVFAADDAYTPMVTTTIRSMLDNARSDRFYDIVVLTSNISGEHQDQMRRCLAGRLDNVWLRFHDVSGIIGEYDLKTSNEHISVETYYRFLVQRVMPYYDKVLYLDSDLVIEGDVAELFDTELGDNLLAAVRDVDYAGNLNMPDHTRINYTNRVLRMKNPYDYFQAGVLLLNTRAMREAYTTKQWLEYASVPEFIYDDQDVLNAHCEGRVRFLDPSWNVMHDCGCRVGNVFSWAPAQMFNDYLAARSHPKIRHYAGFEKPWNTIGCDWAEFYWHYARETPFYEELLGKLYGQGSGAQQRLEKPRPPKAISPKNPIRKFVDPLMPYGTKRREVFKAIGRSVRGLE